MAYGICYTQSGSVKKYEPGRLNRPDQVKWITGYTVGYPSTAYYPGLLCDNFYLFTYDNQPGLDAQYPEFTEGTAIYFLNADIYNIPSDLEPNNNSYISYKKIYNLMSYTPPYGYVLSENGPYTYTAIATVYSCNEDVEYYTAINTVNIGTDTVKKVFKYKKKDEPGKQDTYINYYVTLTLNSGMLNCKCNRVTGIPGTNNGNVTLGIRVQLGDGKGGGRTEYFQFSWLMKNGIDESKSCSVPYYLGSGFTTQEAWEDDNGDGTKTYYTFKINVSIPSPPHG